MKTYASNDDLQCVVGGPIAVVGSLQRKLDEESKRADTNFASYERIKKKFSTAKRDAEYWRERDKAAHLQWAAESKTLRARIAKLENAVTVAAAMAGPSKKGRPAPMATASIYRVLCEALADD